MKPYTASAGLEFCALARQAGVPPDAAVAPRTELSYAVGRRRCGICAARAACHSAQKKPGFTATDVSAFCPNIELLHELIYSSLVRSNSGTLQ